MATFTVEQDASSAFSDPAAATLALDPTVGNFLLAFLSDRNGIAHANHVMNYEAAGAWPSGDKLLGNDQELADANARQASSIWGHIVTASDLDITRGDDGSANAKKLTIFEISVDEAFQWSLLASNVSDSGTGSTSPQSTGEVILTGSGEKLVVTAAFWRNALAISNIGWDHSPDDSGFALGDTNEITHAFSVKKATGTGSLNPSVSWTGSGAEVTAAILVFGARRKRRRRRPFLLR